MKDARDPGQMVQRCFETDVLASRVGSPVVANLWS